ncbi:MAG: trigger factor [Chloroflexi bacterium]|nr:trigger factor [Chloroflexota bacterium]
MKVTATPAPKSSVQLEIEIPAEKLSAAIGEAVRHVSQRTRIAGFRQGKAPRSVVERVVGPAAVLDEAVEHLVDRAYRDAIRETDIVPLTNANVEMVQAEEGKPLIFRATVPVRPEITLGDYHNFTFAPEIEAIDEPKVDKVIEELRDQHATLVAVEDRGAQAGDYAVIGYVGTRDGVPFDGGTAERMPLILGESRLIPGFEDNVMGHRPGETVEFDITFPADYEEASLAGQVAHFSVTLRELRAKVLPEADDALAQSIGAFDDLVALRNDIRGRLGRNALDRARHAFADAIIEYAVANVSVELPEVLVDQEVEVIHDELRSSLARQGITEEAYLKVVEKTEADLHADFRPNAEKRVKVLLVLSKVAAVEGVEIPEADVEAEVARGRERFAGEKKLAEYYDSDRGRSFVRSSMRRSRVVERLIDEWLTAHPEHGPLPHLEDDAPAAAATEAAAGAAAEAAGVADGAAESDSKAEAKLTPTSA